MDLHLYCPFPPCTIMAPDSFLLLMSITLLWPPATLSTTAATDECTEVNFPNQCDPPLQYDYYEDTKHEPSPATNCSSEDSLNTRSPCDCEPCPYECSHSKDECVCEVQTQASQQCLDQVSFIEYSVNYDSIRFSFHVSESIVSLTVICINSDVGYNLNTTIPHSTEPVIQYSITDLVPSTSYNCCVISSITNSKGPWACLSISTSNQSSAAGKFNNSTLVIYGVAIQRTSATNLQLIFNSSEPFDFTTIDNCHVSYWIRSNHQECHQTIPGTSTKGISCASLHTYNNILTIDNLVPNLEYCVNVTLTDSSPFTTIIESVDLYDNSPICIVITSSDVQTCYSWTVSDKSKCTTALKSSFFILKQDEKLNNIKTALVNSLNISEDFVFGEHFKACSSMPSSATSQYLFTCSIIGYMGRNSTVLREMARKALEGKPIAGEKQVVSSVGDCEGESYTTEVSDTTHGSGTEHRTEIGVYLSIMLVLALVIVCLVIVIVYLKLKKSLSVKKKGSNNLTNSQEMILDEVEYTGVRRPSPPPFDPRSPTPPPYPARTSTVSFPPSLIEEIYDDTGMNEKYDLSMNIDAGHFIVGGEGDSASDIETTFNPLYSMNGINTDDEDMDLCYASVTPSVTVQKSSDEGGTPLKCSEDTLLTLAPSPTPPQPPSPLCPSPSALDPAPRRPPPPLPPVLPPTVPRPYSVTKAARARSVSYTPAIPEDIYDDVILGMSQDNNGDEHSSSTDMRKDSLQHEQQQDDDDFTVSNFVYQINESINDDENEEIQTV